MSPAVPPGEKICGTPNCFVLRIELKQIGEKTYVCSNCKQEYGIPSSNPMFRPLNNQQAKEEIKEEVKVPQEAKTEQPSSDESQEEKNAEGN